MKFEFVAKHRVAWPVKLMCDHHSICTGCHDQLRDCSCLIGVKHLDMRPDISHTGDKLHAYG